ncbi:MAG: hypothetical protein IPI58_00360 [Alphaproteobacteria bacterium]|nr:MAG: hypothetical protein IPI58_00360 [Alphaproteobacteria bacterium]
MIKLTVLAVASLGLALTNAAPAKAGTIHLEQGQIVWQPTQCREPTPLNLPEMGSESPAESLNELVARHNQHVAETQATMECLRKEAETDASAAAAAISHSAEMRIESIRRESEQSAAWLRHRQQN